MTTYRKTPRKFKKKLIDPPIHSQFSYKRIRFWRGTRRSGFEMLYVWTINLMEFTNFFKLPNTIIPSLQALLVCRSESSWRTWRSSFGIVADAYWRVGQWNPDYRNTNGQKMYLPRRWNTMWSCLVVSQLLEKGWPKSKTYWVFMFLTIYFR